MKIAAAIISALLLGCITTSCNVSETKILGGYEPDNSLAGSVLIRGYKIEAKGSYDGKILDNFQNDLSLLHISKVSDTEFSLSCTSVWGETAFNVSIPVVAVSGKPYDVTFDSSSNDATVIYNGTKYTPISSTVNGWIKRIDVQPSTSRGDSSSDPATPNYRCEINVNCNNIDGKVLSLKITKVDPS